MFGDERLPERVWDKINKTDSCWLWRGAISRGGYGKATSHKDAHRFVYETLIGSIPEGLEIDHLCRIRHCVNPSHMEPVTRRINVLRGKSPPAQQAKQTHCYRDHKLAGSNLILNNGSRVCRECKNEYQRKRLASNRESINEQRRLRYEINRTPLRDRERRQKARKRYATTHGYTKGPYERRLP